MKYYEPELALSMSCLDVPMFLLQLCNGQIDCFRYVASETLEFDVYGREEANDLRPQTAVTGSAYQAVAYAGSPIAKSRPGAAAAMLPVTEEEIEREPDVFSLDDQRAAEVAEEQVCVCVCVCVCVRTFTMVLHARPRSPLRSKQSKKRLKRAKQY